MTHVTCRLTAKNWDQLRNLTLGNRVWATFTFFSAAVHATIGSGCGVYVESGGQVASYCASPSSSAASHSHQQARHAPPYAAGYAQTLPASSQYRSTQPHSQTSGSPLAVNGLLDGTDVDPQR